MTMKNNYIPIYQYAQKHNLPVQTIYRWIREGKLEDKYKIVIKEVKRIVIDEELAPLKLKK
jgi:predicted site-specific integrase-resolvase